ncbi:MAG: adenylate/guanylate cyclase domain-containing protein [Nitrospinota bacterium]
MRAPLLGFDSGSSRKRSRDVAVLFADIEGCTRLCEVLPPREMNRVIERYFSCFLHVVQEAGGEITEVLGDGLLALFEGSSPRGNASRAVSASLGIQRAAAELNAAEGRRHDPILVNMGINAGPALVGMTRLRSRRGERRVYSARGPVTNVAARLCALASGGQTLVAGGVARMVGGAYRARRLGRRKLKNVTAPVEVFEIVAL